MPVKKYRDVSEMQGNTWLEPGDPRLFAAIRAVWALAARISQPRFPPGVHKHSSIERANEVQEAWDQANFDAFHSRRQNAVGPRR